MDSEIVDQRGAHAYNAVYVNGHPNGSLMVRMAKVEERSEAMEDGIHEIKVAIDQMPKKLLIWLTIIATAIAIFEFLAPSIRKSIGMADIAPVAQSTDATAGQPVIEHHDGR